MSSLLLPVALLLSAVIASPASAARFGPPLLCHPFVIGDAESLPFGASAFASSVELSPGAAAVRGLELLAQGDDLITQLETVRRTAITIMARRPEEPAARATAERWLAVLAGREQHLALLAELEAGKGLPAARARHGRASLVLAYAHEALAELGLHTVEQQAMQRWVDQGLVELPGDGAAHLAATLIGFAHGDAPRWQAQLAQTLALAADDAMLAANVTATMGPCLGASDLPGLAAKALAQR